MSLESIIQSILDKANKEKEKIIELAREEAGSIIQQAKKEAEELCEAAIRKEKSFHENQRRRLIINAKLEGKKNLLNAKQELLESVFEKFKSHINKNALKKEQVRRDGAVEKVAEKLDFYLDKVKFDYETEIAKILFG